MSFISLNDLSNGLEHLDKLKGLPCCGAAPISKSVSKPTPKKQNTVGFVAAAQDTHTTNPDGDLEMLKDSSLCSLQ
jgi:hypothetical protein